MLTNMAENTYSRDNIDLFGSEKRQRILSAMSTLSWCQQKCELIDLSYLLNVSCIDCLNSFLFPAVCRVSTKSVCLVISLTGPRANKTLPSLQPF